MPQSTPSNQTVPEPDAAPTAAASQQQPVVVKKYANRRLYNTETSSYITLDNLADMIRAGRDFVVYDAKSGEDITRGVLTQIIVEEESKGTSMLPTAFLRQLIGFYGGSLQGVVPRYLEQAMSSFARQQQQLRQVVQQTFSPFMPVGVEEMSRQNVAMIERAMSMFNPFHRGSEPLPPVPDAAPQPQSDLPAQSAADPQARDRQVPDQQAFDQQAMQRLQHEIDSLRNQLAIARAEAVVAHAPVVAASSAAAASIAPETPPTAPLAAPASSVASVPLRTSRRDRIVKPKASPV